MKNEQLVHDNIKLVHYLLNRYYPKFKNNEDMIQSGLLGLCKASDSFDETRGVSFSTYASRCILNEFRIEVQKVVKPYGTLSLDYQKYNKDDFDTDNDLLNQLIVEDDTLDDLIYVKDFMSKLTERERRLCEYKRLGYSISEIEELYDFGKRGNINKIIRGVKRKWSEYNGKS